MNGSFTSKSPKSEKLSAYISHYYFHDSKDTSQNAAFYYYPNTKNALTIYKNSSLKIVQGAHTITSPSKSGYSFTYSQLFNAVGKAEINGAFNKIGIVFEPLGLNHFVKENLSELINQGINIDFNYFKKSLSPVLDKVYLEPNIAKKVALLDTYFNAQFIGFKDERLIQIIELLKQKENKHTVNSISENLNISRKTLLRIFKKQLNCTPKEYLALTQFRQAIALFNLPIEKTTLTNLAHESNYYDQSSFIRHFKRVTNFNPKEFFKNLSHVGNHPTFWIID